ncbi:cytidine deaminase-like isoform X2 [Arctopsyche grandis]|uniref:cytidine deaminase-like isoform X2 n=1 Tax=Arctopsyche grandis TaxID=121162 RepID=UPI00406D8C93
MLFLSSTCAAGLQTSQYNPDEQFLIKEAVEARKFAYCPYSKFAVGAAIRTADNIVYRGCNVESSVYTPSVCAERTAVCKAVSEGQRKIISVAVIAYQGDAFTSPCGVCRQVLSEFGGSKLQIYMTKPESTDVLCVSLEELLPLAFSHEYLLNNTQ